MDLEMTGLDPVRNEILEVAAIVNVQIATSRGAAAAPAPGMLHLGPAMLTQMPHPGASQS